MTGSYALSSNPNLGTIRKKNAGEAASRVPDPLSEAKHVQ